MVIKMICFVFLYVMYGKNYAYWGFELCDVNELEEPVVKEKIDGIIDIFNGRV